MCEVQFRAINVNCTEAIDWEIVQVLFDSMEDRPDEGDRTGPYFMIGVNFEFGREVSIEFHDGTDYGGGRAMTAELWRTRFTAVIRGGREEGAGRVGAGAAGAHGLRRGRVAVDA